MRKFFRKLVTILCDTQNAMCFKCVMFLEAPLDDLGGDVDGSRANEEQGPWMRYFSVRRGGVRVVLCV